jgi:PAS domain S-box-containing protein
MKNLNNSLFLPLKQFILLAILVYILIIIAGYYFYQNVERSVRAEKYEELKTIAIFEIDQITQWQNESIADANVISQSVLFKRDFEKFLSNKNNLGLKKSILQRFQTYKEQYKYENVFISTVDGKLLISLDSSFINIDSLTTKNIKEAIIINKVFITDFYSLGKNKNIFLDIIAPLKDENEIPFALIIFRVNPSDYLYPVIRSLPIQDHSFESLIVRKDGDSILYLNELRYFNNSAMNLRIPLSNSDYPGVKAFSGFLGFNEGHDYRGVEIMYYIDKVPGTSWFLESKEDKSEIYSKLRYKAVFIVIFVFLLILLSGLGLVWIYNYRQRNIYKKLFLAEKKLSRSEDQFRFIIEKSTLGISITSIDGKFLRVNPAFADMLGYTIEEMQKLKYSDITYPDDIAESVQGLQDVLTGVKSVFEIEKRYIHKDGSIVFGDVSVALQNDLSNKPLYFMTSIINITNRRKAEEEILKLNSTLEQRVKARTAQYEESNKELEAFSYSVSHDLRAPLRAIEGFSRIVMEDYSKILDHEGNRLLNIISQNTKKMDVLIADLLELSRMGTSEMNLTFVNMTDMAKSIYYEVASSEVINTFNFSLSDLPDAYVDTTLIRQVWINIISNAIKYTLPKANRIIEINGCLKNNMVVYSIKDSGVGFNPLYSDKLFVTFQRLHKSEDFEGSGVGLAIVQRIIRRHNGEVWAKGEVNNGATFFFSLPNKKNFIYEEF